MKINFCPKRIAFWGIITAAFGAVFGWILFPILIKYQMHDQLQLVEGKDIRKIWSNLPFTLEFTIYLFNVTNADEVDNGKKPIIEEVGPYVFNQKHEKVDLVDREEDDSIEYTVKDSFYFDPTKGLSGEEEVILPHSFIVAMAYTVERTKPSMMPIIGKAIDSIFKKPTSIFIKVKARDFLFAGLPIDCTSTDFAAGAVCSMLKDETSLQSDGEDKYLFSMLGPKNATSHGKRLRALRGVKDLMDVGRITEFDGNQKLPFWDGDYCNAINGTDGTIFHPLYKEGENIQIFIGELCRSMSLYYDNYQSEVAGVHTYRYTMSYGDPETDPKLRCFCDKPDKCLKKGVMDAFKCLGVPLIFSFPHFYDVDESYLKMVHGLRPSKEKHATLFDFEIMTGTPIYVQGTGQANFFIHPLEKLRIFKKLPTAMLPIAWYKRSLVIPDSFVSQVKLAVLINYINEISTWAQVVVGIGMCIVALLVHLNTGHRRSKVMEITKVGGDKKKMETEA